MADVIPLGDFQEMTDYERNLVEKAVGVNISLRDATRVEIRECLGIWAAGLQDAIMKTYDIKDERALRTSVAYILKDAQKNAKIYRQKAQRRSQERADRKIRGL